MTSIRIIKTPTFLDSKVGVLLFFIIKIHAV